MGRTKKVARKQQTQTRIHYVVDNQNDNDEDLLSDGIQSPLIQSHSHNNNNSPQFGNNINSYSNNSLMNMNNNNYDEDNNNTKIMNAINNKMIKNHGNLNHNRTFSHQPLYFQSSHIIQHPQTPSNNNKQQIQLYTQAYISQVAGTISLLMDENNQMMSRLQNQNKILMNHLSNIQKIIKFKKDIRNYLKSKKQNNIKSNNKANLNSNNKTANNINSNRSRSRNIIKQNDNMNYNQYNNNNISQYNHHNHHQNHQYHNHHNHQYNKDSHIDNNSMNQNHYEQINIQQSTFINDINIHNNNNNSHQLKKSKANEEIDNQQYTVDGNNVNNNTNKNEQLHKSKASYKPRRMRTPKKQVASFISQPNPSNSLSSSRPLLKPAYHYTQQSWSIQQSHILKFIQTYLYKNIKQTPSNPLNIIQKREIMQLYLQWKTLQQIPNNQSNQLPQQSMRQILTNQVKRSFNCMCTQKGFTGLVFILEEEGEEKADKESNNQNNVNNYMDIEEEDADFAIKQDSKKIKIQNSI